MRGKGKILYGNAKPEVRCVVILSSNETEDWQKAERKENKRLRRINEYADAHGLVPVKIVRRGCFGFIETRRLLDDVLKDMRRLKAEGVLVDNIMSISYGEADAYSKIGKIREAGYRVFSVFEGELKLKLHMPESEVKDDEV